MTEYLRRILLVLAIFTLSGFSYLEWRRNQSGYGLLDLIQGRTLAKTDNYSVPDKAKLTDADVPGLAKFSEESSKLAAAVLPSVVSVNTTGKRIEVLYRDVFGRPIFERQVDDPRLGSGVIVSKEGHVITNFHVVQNSQRVQITTQDRQTYEAEAIGGDPKADIAVLRIVSDRKDFPALKFANSDEVKVGQLVFAIGNPFGLAGTVTQGIISATQRRLSDDGNDLLQTDTVINPGNSGGPLVNYRGEVVGINVAIFTGETRLHAWQGVGLAIPANDANAAFKSIMTNGTSTPKQARGYLGLSVYQQTVAVDSSLGGSRRGAIVAQVSPGSPAADAGIQEGDVVLQYAGRNFNDPMGLIRLIDGSQPGQKVSILLVRNGRLITVSAVVQARAGKE